MPYTPGVAKPDTTPAAPRRLPPRVAILLTGACLGLAWGSVLWLIFELAGRDTGMRGWAYLAITTAMIGAGVAAIFGANAARKRGERVGPAAALPAARLGRPLARPRSGRGRASRARSRGVAAWTILAG